MHGMHGVMQDICAHPRRQDFHTSVRRRDERHLTGARLLVWDGGAHDLTPGEYFAAHPRPARAAAGARMAAALAAEGGSATEAAAVD